MARPIPSEQLSAYLDGELTDQEQAELEEHLASDPALREELEQLESAVTFLRTHGPVQAPPDFKDKVLAAVEDEPMPGRWRRWFRRPFGIPFEGLAVALAAALVLLIALPVGWNTAQKGGGDLLDDPYGFVRSDDARQQAPAARKGEGEAGYGAGPGADVEPLPPDEPAQELPSTRAAPDGTETPTGKAAPSPTGKAAPTPTSEGVADDDGPQPAADATAPAAGEGTWRYEVLTYDADALAQLQRLAARYRGEVFDASGDPVTTGELPPGGGTYVVALPADALPAFGDALRGLGSVTEHPVDRIQRGDTVQIRVDLQLVDARKRAPGQTQAQ